MRVGYFHYFRDFSVRSYVTNLERELTRLGVELRPFGFGEPLPDDVDIYWDPRLTGTTLPTERFLTAQRPCVVTLHDGAPLTVNPLEYYASVAEALRGTKAALVRAYRWRRWRGRLAAVITVSEAARTGVERRLRLADQHIVRIHHGVDHETFQPGSRPDDEAPFFLHVSQYQPVKNVARIARAHSGLSQTSKPRLVVVSPGMPTSPPLPEDIEVIREPQTQQRLADLYRGALGFVFPSLHETFGMPILEAMASGCPVITSSSGACSEVAGDAAILVNPRRVGEIQEALATLSREPETRASLRARGLERARGFTWEASAAAHLEVFRTALESGPPSG